MDQLHPDRGPRSSHSTPRLLSVSLLRTFVVASRCREKQALGGIEHWVGKLLLRIHAI